MSSPSHSSGLPARALIYARFSSDLQRDASIDDQIRECRKRAEREGWRGVSVHTDYAVSGSTTLRPGFQALQAEMRAGGAEVVLAESLDRLSRDQEHIAGFFKQARFLGVRVVTLAEGEISELHVGLKGTMGALYLKDLADKTRRGIEGRVRQGRSGGGLCYGYRVVRGPVGRDGEAERGLREIDPTEAAVVRRIFERFAAGEGPKTIAAALNREGIAGPRGGIWQAGTIRGQAGRDTGILRNRLYRGELVWNQRRWLKDPLTGRRIARRNGSDEVVIESVPELRIVEEELWQRVQDRLATQRAAVERDAQTGGERRRFWERRRPQHVLSGKVVCGGCGTALASVGRDYLACRVAQAGGPCGNRARVRRGALEQRVLEALGSELMRPDRVAEFVEEFCRTWNRLAAEASAANAGRRAELERVKAQIEKLIDALADGAPFASIKGRLESLEARRDTLERELSEQPTAEPPRLHGNLAEMYRAKVVRLREALAGEDGTEAREAVRALIARVEVHRKRRFRTLPAAA
jgi:DNA invertase Pin-like site-specific DNA recombinase